MARRVSRFSASVEQLGGRVGEPQTFFDPGEAQQPLNLLWPAHETELLTCLLGPLVRFDERAQSGGVHELEFTQIEDDLLGVGFRGSSQLLFERCA